MMLDQEKKYKAKLLLFGEYLVLHGSDAFALPIERYYGQFKTGNPSGFQELNHIISALSALSLTKVVFDKTALSNAISQGIYFDSCILTGYGMGSSGALSAALYDQFFTKNHPSFINDRNNLALIESIFQGKSSGTDPLVSYFDTAIHIHKSKIIRDVQYNPSSLNNWYLLDSKIPRKTHALVQLFKNKMEDTDYQHLLNKLLSLNNDLISKFILGHDWDEFEQELKHFSELQLQLFEEMVLEDIGIMWKIGLNSGLFQMKLCGAGGGGYYLVHTQKIASIKIELPEIYNQLIPIIDKSF